MKILLLTTPVYNDIGHSLTGSPPMGLLYLAAYLEKHNYKDVKVVDTDVAEMNWDSIRELLIKEKPDIVGISGVSFVIPALLKTSKIIKKVLPNTRVIVGGFGPTKEPKKVLKESGESIDIVVLGEGEETLLELVKIIEGGGKDFSQVNNIAYLENGGAMKITAKSMPLKTLDEIPWPAYHLLEQDVSIYKGMHANYKEMPKPVTVMIASRGCPHRCTFCSLGSRMYRQRDPIDVVDEIEFYKNKFNANSIQLYDDEFIGLSPKQNVWIEEICDEIIKRGLHKKLAFLVQGRCSRFIELKTLKKMRAANFVWIWWGVESGSQHVLDLIKKDIKLDDVVRDFALAKKVGIKSMMFIMLGFPGETPHDIKLTSDFIKKVKPDQVRVHIVTPYPGSELRKYLEENNLLETTDVYKFDTRTNVIHHTKEMTAEEIKKYYRMLVFRFENGYWYFIKFFTKSLFTIDGWQKLGKRLKMIVDYILDWIKINAKEVK